MLDDEALRLETIKSEGVTVLTDLISRHRCEGLDLNLARDVCSCLSKLAAENNPLREDLIKDVELLRRLQRLGGIPRPQDLAQAAAIGWASLTRSREFGTMCFNQVSFPDFEQGLLASYTVPAWNEDQ